MIWNFKNFNFKEILNDGLVYGYGGGGGRWLPSEPKMPEVVEQPTKIPSEVPEKLFDVVLEMTKNSFKEQEPIEFVVKFLNFGTKATEIKITYIIKNSLNEIKYYKEETRTVEIEDTVFKSFYLTSPVILK